MAVLDPPRLRRLWSSTVGKKAVMGVTGLLLLLFVTAHMLSNLKAFISPASLDHYAAWLRTVLDGALGHGGFLWIARIGLVVCVVLHATAAVQLARRARAARPVRYRHRARVQGDYAARTMRWGGVILALFVVYHLLDLTAGYLNPHGVQGDVYNNVVADFRLWYVTLFYALAVVSLGFHIRHGLWSALQSLGASAAARRAWQATATGYAVFITAGYLSVPFAVLTGLLR
ncbi:succinate dehydrogenase cytochrome b subunit [Amycolatopsis sp. K13G38]|uniref:Succinate dehydrogenase cytochrome b subunit n=1 Tax=Amycolatopsis acididurans TaxID=2724524 RepID=A0ABX1JAN4_9PSEU|nr:succinate dehydrogenase cytochrome b subunit [Amycolatopsis acididurans]NKQ56847.1 succinate dehydrogenase cytochrome b subunit [Amycolatopsis acididurans]